MNVSVKRGSRPKQGWSVGLVALAVLLALVDVVMLRGDRVTSAVVRLDASDPVGLAIERAGEEHLVEIETFRRRHGDTEGRSVDWWIEAPDGRIVAEGAELVSRKRRYARFVPEVAGEYWISVEDEGRLGAVHDSARVTVYVNDRRILGTRIFSALPF